MKLIIEDENFLHLKTISTESNNFEKLGLDRNNTNQRLNGSLLILDRNINCAELKNIRSTLMKFNIKLNCIYTNSRETNLSAAHLKIKTDFNFSLRKKYLSNIANERDSSDLTHRGIVR